MQVAHALVAPVVPDDFPSRVHDVTTTGLFSKTSRTCNEFESATDVFRKKNRDVVFYQT